MYHGRRQTGIVLDRALIEDVALCGVKSERAAKVHGAPLFALGDQRNCNARNVAACEGDDSPGRKPRICPDIINPRSFAGPSGNARWTLTDFHLSPGSLDALQVIEAGSGLGHRPNGLLGIIFAVANPGQPSLAACHENFANGLQQLQLALGLKEPTGALTQRPQSSVEPVQNRLVGFASLRHRHSAHWRSPCMDPHQYSATSRPNRDRARCWPWPSQRHGPESWRTLFPECVTCRR